MAPTVTQGRRAAVWGTNARSWATTTLRYIRHWDFYVFSSERYFIVSASRLTNDNMKTTVIYTTILTESPGFTTVCNLVRESSQVKHTAPYVPPPPPPPCFLRPTSICFDSELDGGVSAVLLAAHRSAVCRRVWEMWETCTPCVFCDTNTTSIFNYL